MSNSIPCGGIEIQRGVTFTIKVEAEAIDGTPFDFAVAGITNSAIFYDKPNGDEVATCTLTTIGSDLIIELDADATAALDIGKLWLQVRSENEAGFVWQFLKGFVNVY
jgi:predicted secreted protein